MSKQLQQQLAYEAARIMSDDGVADIGLAKKKAMQRLGIQDKHLQPDNIDIQSALADYQRLFKSKQHHNKLHDYLDVAKHAMQMLSDYSPRLVGPVLNGTVTENDYVTLHVFTDSPEDIHFLLTDRSIPFEIDDVKLKRNKQKMMTLPACSFFAGDIEVMLVIFPYIGLRQAPLSHIDDKPIQRADLATVIKLISA